MSDYELIDGDTKYIFSYQDNGVGIEIIKSNLITLFGYMYWVLQDHLDGKIKLNTIDDSGDHKYISDKAFDIVIKLYKMRAFK